MNDSQKENAFHWYIRLPVLEGLGLILYYLLFPPEVPRSKLLLILGALLLLSASFAGLAWLAWRKPQPFAHRSQRLAARLTVDWAYWSLIVLAGIGTVVGIYFFAAGRRLFDPTIAYFSRAAMPLVIWLWLMSIQTLILVRILRHGASLAIFRADKGALRAFGVVAAVLLLVIVFMLLSRVGLSPDETGWGAPAVPLLAYQVSFALALTLTAGLFSRLSMAWKKAWRNWRESQAGEFSIDILISVLLWLSACLAWSAQPLNPTWFNSKPALPNLEYYPASDAIHYDFSAQRLLFGAGFEPEVIRPAYSAFLALAQGISGIGYHSVVKWQVPVLALLPAFLYLLGKITQHRLTGLLLGILAIMHENNAIALSGALDVSNSKMIMSDFPAQLGVIIFSLLLIAWLRSPERRRLYPLLAGGALGIFMLVRTQVVVLIIVVPLAAWLHYRRNPARIVQPALLTLLGLSAALAPWILRNLLVSRSLFSDPEPAGIHTRYFSVDQQSEQRLPGESDEEYASRTRTGVARSLLAQPLTVAKIFSGHYLNNHLATLFVMPSSFPVLSNVTLPPLGINRPDLYWRSFVEQCCSLQDYVREAPYWRLNPQWQMDFSGEAGLAIATNLLLVCIGIAASWRWSRWAGMLPLFVSLIYNIGNAVTRLSGWRFNQPVEWVGLFYYSAGWLQIFFWIGMLFSNRLLPAGRKIPAASPIETGQSRLPWKMVLGVSLLFFTLVAAIPVAEVAIPNRLQGVSVQSSLEALEADGGLEKLDLNRAQVEEFLAQEGALAATGRALYPRFLLSRQGSPLWASEDYFKGYERLEFYLLPDKAKVILRLDAPPEYFPNASDILLVGCQRAEYIEAYLVKRIDAPNSVLARSEPQEWDCKEP